MARNDGLDSLLSLSKNLSSRQLGGGVSGTSPNAGVQALLDSGTETGFDPLAFARGQQMARDVGWQQRLRDQQEQRFNTENIARKDALEERQIRRDASNVLKGMNQRRQRSAEMGISPDEFIIEERNRLLNSPEFQNMDPRSQDIALRNVRNIAADTVGQLGEAGELDRANDLMQRFGGVERTSDLQTALLTGDWDTVISEVNSRYGENVMSRNEDGSFNVLGQDIPAATVMQTLQQSEGLPGGLATPASQFALQERQIDRTKQLQQDMRDRLGVGTGGLNSPAGNISLSAEGTLSGEPSDNTTQVDQPDAPEEEETSGGSTQEVRLFGSQPDFMVDSEAFQDVDPSSLSDEQLTTLRAQNLYSLLQQIQTEDDLRDLVRSSPQQAAQLLDYLQNAPSEIITGMSGETPSFFELNDTVETKAPGIGGAGVMTRTSEVSQPAARTIRHRLSDLLEQLQEAQESQTTNQLLSRIGG